MVVHPFFWVILRYKQNIHNILYKRPINVKRSGCFLLRVPFKENFSHCNIKGNKISR